MNQTAPLQMGLNLFAELLVFGKRISTHTIANKNIMAYYPYGKLLESSHTEGRAEVMDKSSASAVTHRLIASVTLKLYNYSH